MAIKPSAMQAPRIELLMLRSEMCENIRLVDAGTVHIVSGVFARSQVSDCSWSSRMRTAVTLSVVTIKRVEDLSTLMVSLRSSPYGNDIS